MSTSMSILISMSLLISISISILLPMPMPLPMTMPMLMKNTLEIKKGINHKNTLKYTKALLNGDTKSPDWIVALVPNRTEIDRKGHFFF